MAVDPTTEHMFVGVDSSEGSVVITSTLAMLNARTGNLLQTIPLQHSANSVAVASKSGRVFVTGAAAGDAINVLDARSGADLYDVPVGGAAGIAIDPQTGRAYVTDPDGEILNPNHVASPRIGAIQALDGHSAHLLWVAKTLDGPWTIALDSRTHHLFTLNPDYEIDFNTRHSLATMLDEANGHLLRRIWVDAYPLSITVDEQTDRVFIGDQMVDARSGAVLHTLPGGLDFTAIDTRANHVFLSDRRAIVMVDGRNGDTRRIISVDVEHKDPNNGVVTADVLIAVDQQRGRLMLIDAQTGRLYVINTHNGNVVRSYMLHWPAAVAVDQRTGHIYVGLPSRIIVLDEKRL